MRAIKITNRNKIIAPLSRLQFIVCTVIVFIFSACEKNVQVDLPITLIPQASVFTDDASLNAAARGMYATIIARGTHFASGGATSVSYLTGLSVDELHNYSDPRYFQYEQNEILSTSNIMETYWNDAYNSIYTANSIIEGIDKSKGGLTLSIKNQVKGEALFMRAFNHLYLVKIYGNVPIITSTDYITNSHVSRVDKNIVYEQIITDLKAAEELIGDDYVGGGAGRDRPNKSTVRSLLARVYLYLGEWSLAEQTATSVINNSLYIIEPNMDNVFLTTSREAIWQLAAPPGKSFTTLEGMNFIISDLLDVQVVLTKELLNSFETGDLRSNNWIRSFVSGTDTLYYPYKYKIKSGSITYKEASTIFRLAEIYLIRAEARAHQNNLPQAITDLDIIRNRAALPLIANTSPNISTTSFLDTVQHERRVELFTEGGHRWFDLIRVGKVSDVLLQLKPHFNLNDTLYPIPAIEFTRNPQLGIQNAGY
jgi:hypothetical protein